MQSTLIENWTLIKRPEILGGIFIFMGGLLVLVIPAFPIIWAFLKNESMETLWTQISPAFLVFAIGCCVVSLFFFYFALRSVTQKKVFQFNDHELVMNYHNIFSSSSERWPADSIDYLGLNLSTVVYNPYAILVVRQKQPQHGRVVIANMSGNWNVIKSLTGENLEIEFKMGRQLSVRLGVPFLVCIGGICQDVDKFLSEHPYGKNLDKVLRLRQENSGNDNLNPTVTPKQKQIAILVAIAMIIVPIIIGVILFCLF
ncbi:MAG: hypothetical protein NT155_00140 [Candidatus Staskawiczbacteria bacterium]|nr:hypothetical protein [Candidatus Staskawiczbacteria bacterium]